MKYALIESLIFLVSLFWMRNLSNTLSLGMSISELTDQTLLLIRVGYYFLFFNKG